MLEWLTAHGCVSEIEYRTSKQGKSFKALVITNPNGGRAILVDPDMEDFLAPSMVSYLQRRLCIKSPYAAQPELTQDPPAG
jgi:hypothetical protein